MIFYFTSTGNSLYAAKHFDEELYSIPQEMKKENRHYKADKYARTDTCVTAGSSLPICRRIFGEAFDATND